MRPSRSNTRHVVPVVPWSIARITGPRLPSAPPHAREVGHLAGPVDEAAPAATGGAMLEIDLDLPQRESGSNRIDGHRRLHAVALGERQDGAQHLAAHRPLPGDRGTSTVARATLDR